MVYKPTKSAQAWITQLLTCNLYVVYTDYLFSYFIMTSYISTSTLEKISKRKLEQKLKQSRQSTTKS